MFSAAFTAFVVIASAISVGAVPAPTSPCAAVHIIAARASTEAPGPGIIGALVTQIQQQSRQTVSTVAVNYPATLTDYANSSAQGTAATMTLLNDQTATCPNQKIVLVGYSQVKCFPWTVDGVLKFIVQGCPCHWRCCGWRWRSHRFRAHDISRSCKCCKSRWEQTDTLLTIRKLTGIYPTSERYHPDGWPPPCRRAVFWRGNVP